jgi:hypothetical protein
MIFVEKVEQHELQSGEAEFEVTLRFSTEDLRNGWAESVDSVIRRAAEGVASRSALSAARRGVAPKSEEITFKEYAGLDLITTQPVVLPNPEPSVVEPPPFEGPLFPPEQVEAIGKALGLPNLKQKDVVCIQQDAEPTPAQKDAQAALATVKPQALANAANEAFVDMAALAKTLPTDHPLAQIAAPAETPKRKRKQTADAQTPAENLPVSPSVVIPESQPSPTLGTLTTTVAVQVTPTLPAQPVEPPKVEKLLTPEQEKEIKERLAKYRNEILPAGGMVPVDQIGGVEIQLRKFVAQFNPAKPSSKTWDYMDWRRFVDFFDDVVKVNGPAALVQHIQQKIGIAK